MRKLHFLAMTAIAVGVAGCGNQSENQNAPAAASSAASAPAASSAPTHAAASLPVSNQGVFAALDAGKVDKAAHSVGDCSLDAVNDSVAQGSMTVAHQDKLKLAGWAGDSATANVPASLQIVLKGAQDFAVDVPTGYPLRTDVAKYKNIPAFANSGYAIIADPATVTPGEYSVLLMYPASGQAVVCDTHRKFTVQ